MERIDRFFILGLVGIVLFGAPVWAVYHQPLQLQTVSGQDIPQTRLSFTSAGDSANEGAVAIEEDESDPGLYWLVFPGERAEAGTLKIDLEDRQLAIEIPAAAADETVAVDLDSRTAELVPSTQAGPYAHDLEGSDVGGSNADDSNTMADDPINNDNDTAPVSDLENAPFDITPFITPLEIGPRAAIGTESLGQKAVKGVIGSALGGLLGGGSSRSSQAQGPKTKRDPSRREEPLVMNDPATETAIGIRTKWTEDGLLVSSHIKKADDRGTFQYVYLVDESGRMLLPKKIEIYKIWQKHTLTVSWTRSEYVDGVLVRRTSGGWTESWTRDLGTFTRQSAGSAIAPGIWQLAGYDRAHAGLRRIGTTFDLDPEQLSARGRLYLVVHITRPSLDPVTTVPFAAQFKPVAPAFNSAQARDSAAAPQLMPFITPVTVNLEED